MSIDASRRLATIAFLLLLALSVVWPQPVIEVNNVCCHAVLAVDDLSFLGREAPSWDLVFWCLAGLFVIALVQQRGDFGVVVEELKTFAVRRSPFAVVVFLAGAAVVAITWRFFDAPLVAWSESLDSPALETGIRYANRFGGGMNPLMVVGFFILAGVAYRVREWVWCGLAMAFAGAFAGILVQLVKFAVGRTRPELWLGPFHHARTAATSFPSGHTVGAFALAGVLMLHSSSRTLRVVAALLAIAVGVSRILAFRHWPSDVVASAVIGLLCAAAVSSPRQAPQSSRSPVASSPLLPS